MESTDRNSSVTGNSGWDPNPLFISDSTRYGFIILKSLRSIMCIFFSNTFSTEVYGVCEHITHACFILVPHSYKIFIIKKIFVCMFFIVQAVKWLGDRQNYTAVKTEPGLIPHSSA